jgi:hypothetical protein
MVSFNFFDALDAFVDVVGSYFDVSHSLMDAGDSIFFAAFKPNARTRSRAEDEPTYIGKGVWSSVQVELGKRAVKRFDWSSRALDMYWPYSVLEDERRSAKYDDKQRQTLSFLDLPGEIRTQIYKLALVFEGIETDARMPSRSHTLNCAVDTHREVMSPDHYRTWQSTVRPALGLLRLNKQINAEAASVFYGHNEFRFTSPNGRDTLEAFCKTIGEANTRRLAKITHHVAFDNRVDRCSCMSSPKLRKRSQIFREYYQIFRECYQILPVWMCKSSTSESKISQDRWKNLPVWLKWTGMHMQGTTESPDFDFAQALTDERGGLREYKLVLPHDWHIRPDHIARHLRCVFDHVVNPHDGTSGIIITLVLLDPNFRTLDRVVSMGSLGLRAEYQLRCEFVKLALQWGWEVVMANTVDKATGNYECSTPLHSLDEFVSKVNYECGRAPHKNT